MPCLPVPCNNKNNFTRTLILGGEKEPYMLSTSVLRISPHSSWQWWIMHGLETRTLFYKGCAGITAKVWKSPFWLQLLHKTHPDVYSLRREFPTLPLALSLCSHPKPLRLTWPTPPSGLSELSSQMPDVLLPVPPTNQPSGLCRTLIGHTSLHLTEGSPGPPSPW